MSKKISKSEKIRQALALKSNKGLSVVDLAKKLHVQPSLVYQIRWKAHGKKNRKAQKQASSVTHAGNGAANGNGSAGGLEDRVATETTVGEAKPANTLTNMIVTLQEALVVLGRIRGIVG